MLRKTMLLMLVVVLVTGLMPGTAAAQDTIALEPCTPEQYQATSEALNEGLAELDALMEVPESPTPEDVIAATAALDAFDLGYWQAFGQMVNDLSSTEAETMPVCAEAFDLIYNVGLALDGLLIINLLNSIVPYDDMLAPMIQPAVEARITALQERMETYYATIEAVVAGEGEMPPALPACTEVDITIINELLTPLLEGYNEALAAGEEDALTAAISLEVLSASYWGLYEMFPACYEAKSQAYLAGMIIDETLIVALLVRVAEITGGSGDTETSDALLASVEVRAQALENMRQAYNTMAGVE